MKKLLLFILPLLFFFLPNSTNASHIIGGEITWECHDAGEFIFKMKVFRDCGGIEYPFSLVNLEVYANPLPRGSNNAPISTILLYPDSSTFLNHQNGTRHFECSIGDDTTGFSCLSGDRGVIQVFHFQSLPMVIRGTPPPTGWRFVYTPPCCRSDFQNLKGSSAIFQSIMYPDVNGSDVYPCRNSSPVFPETPLSLLGISDTLSFNGFSAFDKDFDSLVYSWDRPTDTPGGSPTPVAYNSGYAYNNPTPDQNFNSKNMPATLDPNTGLVRLAVYDNYNDKFLLKVKVDSYTDDHLIATVYRELPVYFHAGFPLDTSNPNRVNKGPKFYFDSHAKYEHEINVIAGKSISIPIRVIDTDTMRNGELQTVVLKSKDTKELSNDRSSTTLCNNPPCAVFTGNIPQYDSLYNTYIIRDSGEVNTTFDWQTECQHLAADGSKKTHYFTLSAIDNFCPLPGKSSAVIKVNILPFATNGAVAKHGKIEAVDSLSNYQWIDCDADTLIPGATSRTFIPPHNGKFAFYTTDGNCTDTSDCVLFSPLGIEKSSFKNQFTFYPNPTTGKVNLNFNFNMEEVQLHVYNVFGQLIQREQLLNVESTYFNIEGAAGIYIIELINNHGEKVNFKVLKQ